MPSINDLKIKKNKKFEKKEFRPWDDFHKSEEDQSNNKSGNIKEFEEDTDPLKYDNEKKDLEIEERSKSFSKDIPVDKLRKLKRRLYGPQKEVLSYLLNNVEFVEGSKLFLKPMVYVEVAEELKISLSNLKSILNKFKKDDLIFLDDYKPGKGGYGCFFMEENIHTFFSSEPL